MLLESLRKQCKPPGSKERENAHRGEPMKKVNSPTSVPRYLRSTRISLSGASAEVMYTPTDPSQM